MNVRRPWTTVHGKICEGRLLEQLVFTPCQPSLQRGPGGGSPRLNSRTQAAFLPLYLGPGSRLVSANQACSGGSGGFPPGSRKECLTLSLFLPALRLSLSLSLFPIPSFCYPLPGSCSRGPSLPGRRTLLTRQADPPYPAGGPSLPGRRTLLTRQAAGGYSLPTAREAGTLYTLQIDT